MKRQRVAIVEIAPVIAEGITSILSRAASVDIVGTYRTIGDIIPLIVAIVAAICMAGFEFLIQKKGKVELENFSLAASMLVAMAAAVGIQMMM